MAKWDDEKASLRARATEVLGDVVIPAITAYSVTPYEVDEKTGKALLDPATGRPVRFKATEYQADEFRQNLKGIEDYAAPIYDGNRFDANTVDDDVNQRPVNINSLAIPTSTSNPSRPRTLAAGYYLYVGERAKAYADQRGKITVMFRDGTFYNYYNVPPGVWQEFKSSISKGPLLNRGGQGKNRKQGADGILLSYPHGPADVTDIPEELQRYTYRVARATQKASVSKYKRDVKVGDKTVRTNYVPTSAQRQVKYSKGKTTSNTTRGRNPYQK